ncbi:MAG: hypothetical protein IPO85_19990 [Saprospiraceae bacterium]|uniref:Uncharacterized protein n=1 Tax=Candidatus Defluviibacterium haderslevense TaxID=2981993 RepID=A0A9D7SE88_9BACT|nr:hypothetical protein [Candidatus Defluviibacterium haderslevense]
MKILFTILLSILIIKSVDCQSSPVIFNYDSILSNNSELYYKLTMINTYIRLAKLFGYFDTISIIQIKNEFIYLYKDVSISDFKSSNSNKQTPLTIDYSVSHGSTFLFTKSIISPIETREITYHHDLGNASIGFIKLSNYKFEVLNGRYEERKADGTKVMEGSYCQIDSIYSIIQEEFDPETYESTLIEYKRIKYPIKIGVWKLYNDDGKIIKKEEFEFCKK